MSTENLALSRRFFDEFCNQRKMNLAEDLFSAGHVYHDPSSTWVKHGPEGMRQLISAYTGALPNAQWAVDEVYESGDTVVTRWTGTGTQSGELLGIPASGKAVTVPGIWVHRISGGKIVESWNIWDTLGMFQQIGAAGVPGRKSQTA